MKHIAIYVLLIWGATNSFSQVITRYYPQKNALEAIPMLYKLKTVKTLTHYMPKFDLDKDQRDDADLVGDAVPYRFGHGFEVSLSLTNGIWNDVEEGRVWSITLESENAISVNFVFNNFYIPEGGCMYIVNHDKSVVSGPISNKDIDKDGFFLTDIFPGKNASIYLFEPTNEKGKSSLIIKRFVHGYRSVLSDEYYGLNGSSASCNINVKCRPELEKESKAIGLVLLSTGSELCSGALVMSTDMSFKPYFLTAFHCIDLDGNLELSNGEISNAEHWMFKFHHKIAECGGAYVATSYTYNSATFRAAWNNTDFALMELSDEVKDNYSLSWLGWDRTGYTPTSGYCIHHPCGDVMKANSLTSSFNVSSWNGTNNHWYVNWEEGITQGGSSGAPFLNQYKRVVGQNHGKLDSQNNLPLCERTRSDGGMFHLSWNGGGNNSNRLSNWLDPSNSNLFITTTHSPMDLLSISGPTIICDSATYYVAGLANGLEVEWSVPYQNSIPYPIMTPSATVNNMCVIRNTRHYPYKGKLNATIKKNGIAVGTLEKDFYSETSELYAYYSQEACYFYGVSHPAISTHSLPENTATFVHQGCMVKVESQYFKYFNSIGYNQNSLHPSYWSYDGENTIRFTLPYQSGGIPFYIEVDGDGACHKHRYLFFAISGNGNINSNYSLQMTPNGNGYDISLVGNNYEESSEDHRDKGLRTASSSSGNFPANTETLIEVYCGRTGQKKLSTHFANEKSYHLNTTGWQTGVYVVRVVHGDIVLAEKIHVK